MGQIHFVDGNKVFLLQRIFVNFQRAGAPEINNAKRFNNIKDFSDTVKLGAGAVIHQVPDGKPIVRSVMIGRNYRQPVETVG